jgi:hypothetical protein
MSKKLIVLVVLALAALTFAVTAQAQKTVAKQDINQATVVSVGDNFLVVKLADGTVKGFDVPAGFMFDQAGTQVPLSALKPGQVVTASITTTEPVTEQVEKVTDATVVKTIHRDLFVKLADGTYRQYDVPKGYRFAVDGKELAVFQLQPGMKLSATIVSEKEIKTMTEAEVQAEVPRHEAHPRHAMHPAATTAPETTTAPAATTAPEATTAKKLPKTASPLPLIGLIGLISLGLAGGLSVLRHREES